MNHHSPTVITKIKTHREDLVTLPIQNLEKHAVPNIQFSYSGLMKQIKTNLVIHKTHFFQNFIETYRETLFLFPACHIT